MTFLPFLFVLGFQDVLVQGHSKFQATPTKLSYAYWFSDLHLDDHYHPGAPDQCWPGTSSGMKCCRVYDIPLKGSKPASKWGDYGCDAPKLLVKTLMDATKDQLFPTFPPDLLIQTGDLVDHHDIAQDFSHNMNEIDIATSALETLDVKDQIFVIGNHDTWPVDQLGTPDGGSTKLTDYLWGRWSAWLPPHQKKNFLEGGYYQRDLGPTLRVIVINSLYDDDHNLLITKAKDPGSQTTWLEEALKTAQKDAKKVWILGHIPPGNGEADISYTKFLKDLTTTYKDIILGQFFGHTHLDSFALYPPHASGSPYAMIMPSVVPDHHDPTVRVVAYQEDGTIVDFHTFSLNLTHLVKTEEAALEKVWTGSEVLGPTLDVGAWWTKTLQAPSMMEEFWSWHHVGQPPSASQGEIRAALEAMAI